MGLLLPRRAFVSLAGAAALAAIAPGCKKKTYPAEDEIDRLVRFPGKAPLRLITDRAPQLETPLHYFRQDLTPNDAFFVRWHLEGIPTEVDTRTFRLRVEGHVEKPLSLSLDTLKKEFEPVSYVAVAQCSGNSRGMFVPPVPGGQWRHGAMGNAKWTGVRIKDLLARAGTKAGAVDVSFGGLDRPPVASIADFAKSLSLDHAADGEVMVAYAMNDAELPMLNGFPLRLVVPGWYATYWVKALDEIRVHEKAFDGFWMKKAYLIPDNPTAQEEPGHNSKNTTPIHRMSIRSIFVRPEPSETLIAGQPYQLEGLAMDAGAGIERVEVSTDSGTSWRRTALGPFGGKYSWRRWKLEWTPPRTGVHSLLVRATSASGEEQPAAQWNHSGYQRCQIERIEVQARA